MKDLRIKLPKMPLQKRNPLSEIDIIDEFVKALQQQGADYLKKYPIKRKHLQLVVNR